MELEVRLPLHRVRDGSAKYNGIDVEAEEAAEGRAAPLSNDHGEEVPGPIHGNSTEDLCYLHYDKIETVGSSQEIPVLVLPDRQADRVRTRFLGRHPRFLGA